MGQDATRRVRAAITTVMDQFGVRYQDVRRRNHAGIMFTVHGQTRTITYGGGDPRAHLNARAQARRTLIDLGLVPKIFDSALAAQAEGTLHMETNDDDQTPLIDDLTRPDEDNEINSNFTTVEEPVVLDGQRPANGDDEIDVIVETEPIPEPRETTSHVIFEPVNYRGLQVRLSQRRFLPVKLDRDLIAEKGTYLLFALDIDNVVWNMPEHEYLSIFAPMVAAEEAAPIVVVDDKVNGAAAPPTDVSPLGDKQHRDDEPAEYPRAQIPLASQPGGPKRGVSGVSPQMGRVLLAMQYLHQQENEAVIHGPSIQSLLSPVDAKQVSGMLSGAIKLRYVVRVAAMEGRGTRYRLNAAGRKLALSLGTWPYDHRGLAVPPWLRESLRAAPSR